VIWGIAKLKKGKYFVANKKRRRKENQPDREEEKGLIFEKRMMKKIKEKLPRKNPLCAIPQLGGEVEWNNLLRKS